MYIVLTIAILSLVFYLSNKYPAARTTFRIVFGAIVGILIIGVVVLLFTVEQ